MKKNILHISKLVAIIGLLLMGVSKADAQVTVDAKIDSLQLLIGEQAKVELEVSLNANQKLQLPLFSDTLVRGVEILEIAKPDTQMLNAGKRMLVKQEYTITSFDSALYYLPPFEVLVDDMPYCSKALALKVYSVPVDTLNPDQFFGRRYRHRTVICKHRKGQRNKDQQAKHYHCRSFVITSRISFSI